MASREINRIQYNGAGQLRRKNEDMARECKRANKESKRGGKQESSTQRARQALPRCRAICSHSFVRARKKIEGLMQQRKAVHKVSLIVASRLAIGLLVFYMGAKGCSRVPNKVTIDGIRMDVGLLQARGGGCVCVCVVRTLLLRPPKKSGSRPSVSVFVWPDGV